ncbi:MAG: transcriptional repressor [Bacteroidales bacterium]|nr:transcriptional repressor [Fournierella massiliensis]MCF2556565.1 transcriptional repressor [Fournierella massiliensis]MCI6740406.1 transcriptional repressor [Bacteroidales bacterium]
MRYSRQKEMVLNEVLSRCDHPTADEIYTSVRAKCPGISLGTVYRNLNSLVEMGSVRRVGIPGKADRFDRTLEQHNHMYCLECGCVQDVLVDEEALRAVLEKTPELQLEGYSLTLYGRCPGCRRKARLQ